MRGSVAVMTISFTQPEFHASVAEVRRTADHLTSARARASRSVDVLLDSWHGAAAVAFAEAWSDWLLASGVVATGLADTADALEAFRADLTTCDARSASSLALLEGRLS